MMIMPTKFHENPISTLVGDADTTFTDKTVNYLTFPYFLKFTNITGIPVCTHENVQQIIFTR